MISDRFITLGTGRRVSLAAYTQAWREVRRQTPDTPYKSSLCDWWPTTAGEILAEFRAGLNDRINSAVPAMWRGRLTPQLPPRPGPGRKHSDEYQLDLKRDAWLLNGRGDSQGRRIRTPEVRARLAADHVHTFWGGGGHRLCADVECEDR